MKKVILVFICLLGLVLTITIKHQDSSSYATTETVKTSQTQHQPQIDPETQAAYFRFNSFLRDNSLREKLRNNQLLNDVQIKSILGFMVRDKFFRKGLLQSISQTKGNEWVASLSEQAQLRFLQIVTSYPPSKLGVPLLQEQIEKKLLRDPEIGPVLSAKYGDNVKKEFFQDLSSVLSKKSISGHLMSFFD